MPRLRGLSRSTNSSAPAPRSSCSASSRSATLAAALLHGPALAGLGLVGAYVTPILVATAKPNYWALYIYLAVVTAAAFVLARVRLWRWLALTAIVFGAVWMFPGLATRGSIGSPRTPSTRSSALRWSRRSSSPASCSVRTPSPATIDGVSSGALAAYLVRRACCVLASRHDALALIAFAVLTAATVAIAWRTEAGDRRRAARRADVALVFLQWALDIRYEQLMRRAARPAWCGSPQRVFYGTHLALGAGFAALFGVAGFLAQGRSNTPTIPILWSASAVLAPIIILIALYYRISNFERSIPFAGLALLLAALFGIATEILEQARAAARPRHRRRAVRDRHGRGAGARADLLARKGLAHRRACADGAGHRVDFRQAAVAAAAHRSPRVLVLVVLRASAGIRASSADEVGTTPIFNWLLYGYGVPAAAFWFGGHLLRRRADDLPARMVEPPRSCSPCCSSSSKSATS